MYQRIAKYEKFENTKIFESDAAVRDNVYVLSTHHTQ